jgi:hypothetical protein
MSFSFGNEFDESQFKKLKLAYYARGHIPGADAVGASTNVEIASPGDRPKISISSRTTTAPPFL